MVGFFGGIHIKKHVIFIFIRCNLYFKRIIFLKKNHTNIIIHDRRFISSIYSNKIQEFLKSSTDTILLINPGEFKASFDNQSCCFAHRFKEERRRLSPLLILPLLKLFEKDWRISLPRLEKYITLRCFSRASPGRYLLGKTQELSMLFLELAPLDVTWQ
jgi:hypothetical protein